MGFLSRIGPTDRYPLALLVLFAMWWTALAIAPAYRQDWALENAIVVVAIPVLILTYRNLRFSNAAYTCLFTFLLLHEVGSHYTYSEVPYDAWIKSLTGTSVTEYFGATRNHYDRLVHFLYGVLVLPAAVELLDAKAHPTGVWRYLLPVFFMNSHAVLYETAEWLAALAFGGELGEAYLGTQGDVWDAQADMALAMIGSVISLIALMSWRAVRRRRA